MCVCVCVCLCVRVCFFLVCVCVLLCFCAHVGRISEGEADSPSIITSNLLHIVRASCNELEESIVANPHGRNCDLCILYRP